MIKVYTGLKGFMASLLFFAAIILIVTFFFWGITKAIELLLPVLEFLAYALVAAFLIGVLPCTIIKQQRPQLAWYATLMAQVLGAITWLVSLFFVIKACGFLGIFLACLLQLLVPVAIAGALVKQAWSTAQNLSVWICFSYVMKFYSRWVMNLNPPPQEKGQVIDVEVIRPEDRIS